MMNSHWRRIFMLIIIGSVLVPLGIRTYDVWAAEDPVLRIGYCPSTYELTNYYGIAAAALQAHLRETGIAFEFINRAPELEADIITQLTILEEMIADRVDYLIIGPSDFWGVVPAIKKANAAGIPTMICAYLDPHPPEIGVKVLSYFGESNFKGGQITGEWVWEQGLLHPGDAFALMLAEPGNQKSEDRGSAGHIWEERGAHKVATYYAHWELDEAYAGTEYIIARYPEVKAIYAISSAMATGAAQAVHAAGLSGTIDVYGFGCVIPELDLIWEGRIRASGFRDPASNGRDMAMAILKHLRGEPVPFQHPLDVVMIGSRQDILEQIPRAQLQLMDHWPDIEPLLH